MPRSRSKSASNVRPSASTAVSVAHDVEERTPPLSQSLGLSRQVAQRLSDFQREHVQFPPLQHFKFRTVYVPMLDASLRPMLRADGKPLIARVVLEVAWQDYTSRPRWGARPRAVWFFVAWDIDGTCLQKVRRRSRAGALKWYKRSSATLRVVRTEKRYVLVTAPKAASFH